MRPRLPIFFVLWLRLSIATVNHHAGRLRRFNMATCGLGLLLSLASCAQRSQPATLTTTNPGIIGNVTKDTLALPPTLSVRRLTGLLDAKSETLPFTNHGTAKLTQPGSPYQSIVVEGDSLFSSNNGQQSWPNFFAHSGIKLWNLASGGQPIAAMVGRYMAQVHPHAPEPGARAIFILEGGHGDLNELARTGAQAYSNALAILTRSAADGFTNVLCTVAPSAYLTGAKEQARLDYNALVRAGTTNGYRVFDLDRIIAADTHDRRYYQPDGLHWTPGFEQWLGVEVVPEFIRETSLDFNAFSSVKITLRP